MYDALLEALAAGDTAIPSSLYMSRYSELKRENPATGKSQCHEEFEVLFPFAFSPFFLFCFAVTVVMIRISSLIRVTFVYFAACKTL